MNRRLLGWMVMVSVMGWNFPGIAYSDDNQQRNNDPMGIMPATASVGAGAESDALRRDVGSSLSPPTQLRLLRPLLRGR